MKYEIGQSVWLALWDSSDNYVTCPDCGGTGRLRVTFHDETQVSVECQRCGPGYERPTGSIKVYDRRARVVQAMITGAEIDGMKVEWKTDQHYRLPEDEIYDSEADAMAAAIVKADQANREERERIQKKEKDTRSWSWNATYHRRCLKEAQRQIEYHTAKLAVASLKAKEAKADAA